MRAAEPLGGVPAAMRAWQYGRTGGDSADALKLSSAVPVPKPGAREVLVKVQAASINPVDWKLQEGYARPLLPLRLPWTPGFDVAGEVVQVGSAVTALKAGDQVFGMVNVAKGGSFAEYAVVPAYTAARRPPNVPPRVAASLPTAGLTALQFLRDWGKVPMGPKVDGFEDTAAAATQNHKLNVLVANAAGGVGHYAVQIAKLAGVNVTATCGQRNAEWVKSLGADEVLDYKTPEGASLKSPSGKKYDVLLDGTLNLKWRTVAPVLTANGKWLHLTPSPAVVWDVLFNFVSLARQRVYTGLIFPRASDLSILGRLASDGQLKTTIDAAVPFAQADEAWRRSREGHATGKIVVVLD